MCRVSGSRRYSADLLQGVLEVPCVLTFQTSNANDIENVKTLIDQKSTSFPTLIKVSAVTVEKTKDLNFLSIDVPKLYSTSNLCSSEK